MQHRAFRSVILAAALAAPLAACATATTAGQPSSCTGAGQVVVQNGSALAMEVWVYRPDGTAAVIGNAAPRETTTISVPGAEIGFNYGVRVPQGTNGTSSRVDGDVTVRKQCAD